MNQKEWKHLCNSCRESLDFTHYNDTRKIQKSLQYNSNPEARIIHHLRDTEEQRKYNDEHYEYWGHNLDGTFEYGKYVVFVTKEEHSEIHRCSEETRKKRSKSLKGHIVTKETRCKLRKRFIGRRRPEHVRELLKTAFLGKHHSDKSREKISNSLKGKISGMKDKHQSDSAKEKIRNARSGVKRTEETKKKISESKMGHLVSDETRKKISERRKQKCIGKDNPFYGRSHSKETLDTIRAKLKERMRVESYVYSMYKKDGGALKWSEFRRYYKDHQEEFSSYINGVADET